MFVFQNTRFNFRLRAAINLSCDVLACVSEILFDFATGHIEEDSFVLLNPLRSILKYFDKERVEEV